MKEFPSRFFKIQEFSCKCGLSDCDAPTVPEPALVALLDGLRDDMGEPLVITSGLRCFTHNLHLGGTEDSGHLTGTEVDVACPSSAFRYRFVTHALSRGVRRIGLYKKHIHVGVTPTALPTDVIWVG